MSGGARRLAAAALLICSVGLGACGDGNGGSTDSFLPGNPRIGAGGGLSGAAQANCEQWRDASYRQRQAVVEQLGELALRGNRPGEKGAELPADEAYEILDRACSQDFARKFKLYKVYNRALVFSGR